MVIETAWISIGKAISLLAAGDLFRVTEDFVLAHKFAWDLMLERLESGEIQSRTYRPETYHWAISVDGNSLQNIPLDDECGIQEYFWGCFKNASEYALSDPLSRLPILRDQRETFADRDGSDFKFRKSYSSSETIFEGAVCGVEILRTELPGTRKRGRKKGSSKFEYRDHVIAYEAIAYMRKTGCKRNAAAKLFADKIDGHTSVRQSKVSRLDRVMKQILEANITEDISD